MKPSRFVIPLIILFGQGCASLSQNGEQTAHYQLGEDLTLSFVEVQFKAQEREACQDTITDCLKNGSIGFGFEGSAPLSYLKRLTLHIETESYELDSSHTYNALLGKPAKVQGVVKYLFAECQNAETCLVRGIFSDAGASYVAEWQVIEAKPIRTVLTSSQDVVTSFRKSLAPPRFD